MGDRADLCDPAVRPFHYYAARSRPPSQRSVGDAWLAAETKRVWKQNYEVYGVRKVWRQLNPRASALGVIGSSG